MIFNVNYGFLFGENKFVVAVLVLCLAHNRTQANTGIAGSSNAAHPAAGSGLRAYIRFEGTGFSWLLDEDVSECNSRQLFCLLLALPETDSLRHCMDNRITAECNIRISAVDWHAAWSIDVGESTISTVMETHKMESKLDGVGRKYIHLCIYVDSGKYTISPSSRLN